MPKVIKDHKGKKIVLLDFNDLKEEEMISLLSEYVKETAEKKEQTLLLAKMGNSTITPGFLTKAKELAPISEPFEKKAAILDISGVRKVLLQGYNMVRKNKLVPFEDEISAMDWLAKED